MIPFLGSVEALSVFHAFLNNERQSIEVRAARYDQAKRHWEASSETTDLHWPKTGILYP
jgi:hypothetical protein